MCEMSKFFFIKSNYLAVILNVQTLNGGLDIKLGKCTCIGQGSVKNDHILLFWPLLPLSKTPIALVRNMLIQKSPTVGLKFESEGGEGWGWGGRGSGSWFYEKKKNMLCDIFVYMCANMSEDKS